MGWFLCAFLIIVIMASILLIGLGCMLFSILIKDAIEEYKWKKDSRERSNNDAE